MPGNDSTRVNTQLEAAIKALLFDQPIAYHPAIAHAVGSVTAGVLLSQLLYWTPRSTDSDGWVWKTQDQLHAETGLTRKEQESARRYLRDAEVLEERKAGVPAKLYFRVNVERLTQLLAAVQDARFGHPKMPKTGIQERPEGAGKPAQIVHAISETTTEITAESTNRDSATTVAGKLSNSKARTRQKVQGRAVEGHAAAAQPPRSSRGMTRLSELLQGSPEPVAGRAERDEKGAKRPRIAQTTSTAERGPISAAQTLQRPPEATPTEAPLAAEQLAALTATIQTLSEKLGDNRHWRSNLTQARRILSASGLNANAWTGLLWSVYHRTHEQQGHLRRPMAWFFTALREEATQHSTPKNLHASFSADPPRKSLAGQYEHLVHR